MIYKFTQLSLFLYAGSAFMWGEVIMDRLLARLLYEFINENLDLHEMDPF